MGNYSELIGKTADNNPLYKLFSNNQALEVLSNREVEQTVWRKGSEPGKDITSKKSLRIKTSSQENADDLIDIFNLDTKLFAEKFSQAISGDGYEAKRIRTLHSSALLCLLCFYGVSESKPLDLTINDHRLRFTKSFFEIKNPVLEKEDSNGQRHCSNMDVKLEGIDTKSGKNVVLFLESKFSEYLTFGKYSNISNEVYKDVHEKLSDSLKEMELMFKGMDNKPGYSELVSREGKTRHYAGGIKQMISHFLGVKNVSQNEDLKDCDIYLAEILYKFPESIDVDPNHTKFNDYDKLYRILAKGLNKISPYNVSIASVCLTYQDVFNGFNLDSSVKKFYSL